MLRTEIGILMCLAFLAISGGCIPPALEEAGTVAVSNQENIDLIDNSSQLLGFAPIRNHDGVLVFQSMEHVDSTLEYLINLDKNWTEEFEHSENSVIIPDEALDYFEESLGFYSLRKVIEADEEGFLLSGSEDWSSRLEATHFILDDMLRTILSPYCEIKVGTSIIKLIDDDIVVEITDGSLETRNAVRQHLTSRDAIFDFPPSEELRNGNIVIHWKEHSFAVPSLTELRGGGPSVENGCPSQEVISRTMFFWDSDDRSSTNTTVRFRDNVSSLLPSDNSYFASSYDLLVGNVDGTGLTPIFSNQLGNMGTYFHTFSEPGAYLICLVQNYLDQNGNSCGQAMFCDTVITGACCQSSDRLWSDAIYANNTRRIEYQLKVVNNWFQNRIKGKTVNYRRRSNGKWRQDRADFIQAGLIIGFTQTGDASVYYKRNPLGECNVALLVPDGVALDVEPNKKRARFSWSPPGTHGTRRFWINSGSINSRHGSDDQNDQIVRELSLTDNCSE